MVRTRVELVSVRDLNPVAHLYFRVVSPLVHESTQFKVAVHCIVVELLFVDLVLEVFKSEVDPVKQVKCLHVFLEKLCVDVAW